MRKWFKDLRMSKGYTQEKLADMVDVDTTTINKIELGHRRPSVEVAKSLGELLGFDWTMFFNKREKSA